MLREESPGQSSRQPGSYAPLDRVEQKESETENKIYYFHTDQIGTSLEMTDAEGQFLISRRGCTTTRFGIMTRRLGSL
ncbi:hypothetical protein ALP74_200356 [Pseudomonas coronafaciens pv. garcae]|uniref:RHS protein conserved region domain-containing protein n=1 Tax=Pseudomonas coronafaciens pv. garcae TaxID=251653 RepID=A0AB37QGW9_9PSED|nr:hypothetical protein ALP74_200356 [Pseudomonas coronafaciens pv. garcae]